MKKFVILFSVLCLSFLSCTSSNNDDGGGDGLSNNACSTLGLQTRIIQGTACSEENSPVVAIVLSTGDGTTFLCSGTMITSTDVLTAAHCFENNPATAYVFSNGTRVNGVRYTVHPDVVYTGQAVFNDVAILRLESAAPFPTLPLIASTDVRAGDTFQIYGYGVTEDEDTDNDTSGVLRSGEMLTSSVTSDHITASFNGDGSNTCFGDSGGPAILQLPSGAVGIVGVTSSGALADCGSGDVSLFANLQGNSIFNFIVQAVPGVGVI